ncbi:MAG: fibronectin type III domain-containing protein, partial [bacterium]|nr:fibronectin type III domain-containing protein [bacterium]
ATLSQNTTYYVLRGLLPNTSQVIYLEVLNAVGVSSTVAITRYTLANEPVGLSVVSIYFSSVSIIWGSNGNFVDTFYEISYSTDNFATNFSTIAYSSYTVLTSTLTGLVEETTYYIRVRARNFDNIHTQFSNVVAAFTKDSPPIAPSNLSILNLYTFISSATIELSWAVSNSPDVNYYEVHYDSNPPFGDADTLITSTPTTSILIGGLILNTTYFFAVVAVDNPPIVIKSTYSNIISTFTALKPPPQVATFSGVAHTTYSIQWSWSDTINESGYNLVSSTGVIYGPLASDTVTFIETGLIENSSSNVSGIIAFNLVGGSTKVISPVWTLALSPSIYVMSVTSDSVTININPTNATLYRLERSLNGINFVFVSSFSGITYIDTQLNPETTYYYRVSGINYTGVHNPNYSNIVSTRTNVGFTNGIIDVYTAVENVKVTLIGNINKVQFTDSTGHTAFTNLTPGVYVIEPYKESWSFSPSSYTVNLSSAHFEVYFTATFIKKDSIEIPAGSGGATVKVLLPAEDKIKIVAPESMKEFKGGINPDKGELFVVFNPVGSPKGKTYRLRILRQNGDVVFETTNTLLNETDTYFRVKPDIPAGVYIVIVEGDGVKDVKKIVIIR